MQDDILTQPQRPELSYVFSFNADGLWLNSAKNAKADEKNIITQWAQMIQKINEE